MILGYKLIQIVARNSSTHKVSTGQRNA